MNSTKKNYSGIGPSSFNKRQLYEIIKLREKQGIKPRRAYSLSNLDNVTRKSLVNDAKRVRMPNSWKSYLDNKTIKKYA